nr:DNA methyltransferase [uncultured Mediterranean phage uvMED]BAR29145.1 DNA methyltransferase [uncultured Mediterranean phage uvMED]BAR29212.1 DNA methyltransferase [uncultured Mediterranean phage uvMED]
MQIKILQGDCIESLKKLEDQSVNTCITSPPYWGLRNYNDEEKQLGMEDTPEEFVENLVKVFREVKRVLRDDGTVWLNLGDSFLPNKQLGCMPFRVALALQQDGWYLRQDIIWHKPNPMPESVKDRCTKAHEYIFLLSKNPKYYFDNEAIKEDSKYHGKDKRSDKGNIRYEGKRTSNKDTKAQQSFVTINPKKNKRSVWTITTKPFKGAHFATFPMDLIEPCVLAGCPEKVCVKCNEPYINKPIYEYISKTSSNGNTHGKYKNQNTESANRQGLHANRGDKLIEVRDNLPKQSIFVNFLRSKTNAKTLAENTNIKLTKIEHWFRADEAGFAYPSIEDWEQVRDFVNDWSNEFTEIDNSLTTYELKSDAVESKKITGYELKKQCDCETNETKAGTVLDPFAGSGTTGIVAANHARNSVLLELNKEYIELAEKRINDTVGMFVTIKKGN